MLVSWPHFISTHVLMVSPLRNRGKWHSINQKAESPNNSHENKYHLTQLTFMHLYITCLLFLYFCQLKDIYLSKSFITAVEVLGLPNLILIMASNCNNWADKMYNSIPKWLLDILSLYELKIFRLIVLPGSYLIHEITNCHFTTISH